MMQKILLPLLSTIKLHEVRYTLGFVLINLWMGLPLCAYSQFVSVQCNNFELNGSNYYPLVINYIVSISYDYNNHKYFLSPHWNYSSLYGVPQTGGSARFYIGPTGSKANAYTKLGTDMTKISSLGFNTLRIIGMSPGDSSNNLLVPTYSYQTYYNLLDQLLDTISNHGLKAILLIGDNQQYLYLDQFRTFLTNVCGHLKNNGALMAYDICNEPWGSFPKSGPDDKYLISNWMEDWFYTIKSSDPNHLVTIGLTGPENVISWDPEMMTVDFLSFHSYAFTNNVQNSEDIIGSDLYWFSKNIKKPWILGETGYSGTNTSVTDPEVGTELQQKSFADFTTQRSLDCSCRGYSWWQYQEVDWGIPWENYLGLFTRDPAPAQKAVGNSFVNFHNLFGNTNNCLKPTPYYNLSHYTNHEIIGQVVDNNGYGVEDAQVIGWKNIYGNYPYYTTFTDADGLFTLYTDYIGFPVTGLWISYPGYSTAVVNNPQPLTSTTYTITPVKYNGWTKRWTNDNNNKILNFNMHSYDKYVAGDFDGDEKGDLLSLDVTDNNNDVAILNEFNNGSWQQLWTNNGTDWIGSWNIKSIDKYLAGDFDGDGKKELLCLENTNTNDWWTMQKFSNGAWSNVATNSGSDYIGPWQLQANDQFFVGDFDGDGKDELLCIQVTNNSNNWYRLLKFSNGVWSDDGNNNGNDWIGSWQIKAIDKYYIGDLDGDGKDDLLCCQYTGGNSDWITLMGYINSIWQNKWTNNGNSQLGGGLYPYRNKLILGNFDRDAKDEILGFTTWGTKFDYDNNNFVWTWSTNSPGYFSDWHVSTSDYYFSFKAYANDPDYLFAYAKYGSYLADMYSMNNNAICINGRYSNSLLDTAINGSMFIYPNPNSGMCKIIFHENIGINPIVQIYNSFGELESSVKYTSNKSSEISVNASTLKNGLYFVTVVANGKEQSTKFIIIR